MLVPWFSLGWCLPHCNEPINLTLLNIGVFRWFWAGERGQWTVKNSFSLKHSFDDNNPFWYDLQPQDGSVL